MIVLYSVGQPVTHTVLVMQLTFSVQPTLACQVAVTVYRLIISVHIANFQISWAMLWLAARGMPILLIMWLSILDQMCVHQGNFLCHHSVVVPPSVAVVALYLLGCGWVPAKHFWPHLGLWDQSSRWAARCVLLCR